MQMQDLSYNLNNQKINVRDFKVSVEVFSLENIYTVKDESYTKTNNTYYSKEVIYGNDVIVEDSSVTLVINDDGESIRFEIDAKLDKVIRKYECGFEYIHERGI